MPQTRFDSCVVYDGLTPTVSINRVTFEPPLDADQAESNTGYLTVNAGFTETVETEAQDTWFDDQEGQTFTRTRTLLSTDSNLTKMLFTVVRAVTEERNGQEGDYQIIVNLINGEHNFTQEEAIIAGEVLGLRGVHTMAGHVHPGRTHQEFVTALMKLAACVRVLESQNIQTATVEGSYGRHEAIFYRERGRDQGHESVGRATFGDLYVLESGLTDIVQSPNFSGLEKTIGDDGEEIRVADFPRVVFNGVGLDADHLTIMMFTYIDTNALRDEFDERPDGNTRVVDFTFSTVASAIVQSNIFIPPFTSTGDESLNPDTGNVSPQASIFQDLRGVFAISNRTLDVPAGYTARKDEGAKSSGVSLAGFEDEISAMSVDIVNEEVRNTLSRHATVFSELWASRRRNDAIDLSFVFNESLFLKQSSTFPKLYKNDNFVTLANGLGAGVSRIKVYKQLVNPRMVVNDNSLNTTSRSSLMQGRDEEKTYISVGVGNEPLINEFTEQLYFGAEQPARANRQGLKFITCTDYENEDSARNSIGNTYRYGVEIDYIDPTIDMVLRMTNLLLEKAQEFKDIANDLGTLPSSTSEQRRRLHDSTEIRCNRILGASGTAALLDNLAEVSIIGGAQDNISNYLEQLKGNSSQTVYERAEGIYRIADIFEFYGSELENELRKTIPGIEVYPGDDNPESANYASSAGSGAGSTSRSVNSIDYVFNKTVPSDQGAGYDYLRFDPVATENPGFELISLTDFLNRCDIETEKHFNDIAGIRGITKQKVKYLTPAAVVNPLGQVLVQDSESRFLYKDYVDFTAGLISYKSQKKDVVAVNKSSLEAGGSPVEVMLAELSKKGATVEYFTDTNRTRQEEANRASFSRVALGNSDNSGTNTNQEDLRNASGNLQDLRGEDQETRDAGSDDIDVSKALINLLGPVSVLVNENGTQNFDKVNSFTKVVLETPQRSLSDLSTFPNQLKAMVGIVLAKHDQDEDEYEKYNYNFDEIRPMVGPNEEQTGLTDPMRDFSRFASYWLNYKQIKKIEILSGFERTDAEQINTATAIWREITPDDINRLPVGNVMMCRFSSLTGDIVDMLGLSSNSGLDLPVYNEYFLLTRTDDEENVNVTEETPQEEPENPEVAEEFIVETPVPDLEGFGGNLILEDFADTMMAIPPLNLDRLVLADDLEQLGDRIQGPQGMNFEEQNVRQQVTNFQELVRGVMGQGAGVARPPRDNAEREYVGTRVGNLDQQNNVQQGAGVNVADGGVNVRNVDAGVGRNVGRNVGRGGGFGGGFGGGGGY